MQFGKFNDKPSENLSRLSEYNKLDQVGQGRFGKVFKCPYMKDGITKTSAVKSIPMSSKIEGIPMTALREISVLKRYHHPNIIELYDVNIDQSFPPFYKGHFDLIYEYMEHDISSLINNNISFSLGEIKNIMFQILSGLDYLHHNYVIHRDIKSANILLDNSGVIKIGDFGLARAIYRAPRIKKEYSLNVVTIWYRPPELLLGQKTYDAKIDIWSAGCVFAELLINQPLFKGNNELEQINEIFKICGTPDELSWPTVRNLPQFNEVLSHAMFQENNLRNVLNEKSKIVIDDVTFDLLQKMLTPYPKMRITAKEALNHSFFSEEHEPKKASIRKFSKEYHNSNSVNKNFGDDFFEERSSLQMLVVGKKKYEDHRFYCRNEEKKKEKLRRIKDDAFTNSGDKQIMQNLDSLFG